MSEPMVVINIYGKKSWRDQYARAAFRSDPALRWHLMQGNNRTELIAKGLIFTRGHNLMTAEPQALLVAIIDQVKDASRKSVSATVSNATAA
ncbi:hypothetical protein [Cupriavidus pauculus]|nr:hypothetical protein [Cupriavidus pauculus]